MRFLGKALSVAGQTDVGAMRRGGKRSPILICIVRLVLAITVLLGTIPNYCSCTERAKSDDVFTSNLSDFCMYVGSHDGYHVAVATGSSEGVGTKDIGVADPGSLGGSSSGRNRSALLLSGCVTVPIGAFVGAAVGGTYGFGNGKTVGDVHRWLIGGGIVGALFGVAFTCYLVYRGF